LHPLFSDLSCALTVALVVYRFFPGNLLVNIFKILFSCIGCKPVFELLVYPEIIQLSVRHEGRVIPEKE
jgi:hypothetical protein